MLLVETHAIALEIERPLFDLLEDPSDVLTENPEAQELYPSYERS